MAWGIKMQCDVNLIVRDKSEKDIGRWQPDDHAS